jgi:predicted DNA-binding transcriptional regulator AlpA
VPIPWGMRRAARSNTEVLGPVLLSAAELGHYLGVSTATVHGLAGRAELPKPYRVGARNKWRIDEVDRWLQERSHVTHEDDARYLTAEKGARCSAAPDAARLGAQRPEEAPG